MKTPVLETERLILRPLSLADADVIFTNWTSDPEVAKYTIWNVHQSVEDTKNWLKIAENEIDSDLNIIKCFRCVFLFMTA